MLPEEIKAVVRDTHVKVSKENPGVLVDPHAFRDIVHPARDLQDHADFQAQEDFEEEEHEDFGAQVIHGTGD
jgi:hypothetical protein